MEIVRRNEALHFGELVTGTWFPPRLGGRGYRQRWANPSIYRRKKRPLEISRYADHFMNAYMDFCFDGGVKRKYRGVAYCQRAENFISPESRTEYKKSFCR